MLPAARDFVYSTIISTTHNMTRAKAVAVMRSELRVFPSRFPLRRRTEMFLPGVCPSTLQHHNFDGTRTRTPMGKVVSCRRPSYFYLSCPRCSATLDAANRKLYSSRGWTSLLCNGCGRSAASRRWKCTCGSAWTACQTHRPLGYACIASSRKTKGARRHIQCDQIA